ncbi:carboxypeptidase O [Alligator sinensis]|uniref:Carboxypeptidase O n=1 Tax=Alligator sinensis TaxID=38654 RepID=A0A1U8DLP4_ALLSI|nr:carboxypeptidase O [Alligator sinensis]
MSTRVQINDVQEQLDSGIQKENSSFWRALEGYNYTVYHPMEEIYHWMYQIKESNRELVTQHYLGTTYEKRPMYYLKISQPTNKAKKIIWMDCGIHAIEWISPAFCQWFVKEILQNYRTDTKISSFLQNLDLYVLPVLNIDGYIYSWTTARLWRKSRSSHMNGTCFGTDLNRNFNSSWGGVGTSHNCSSSTYCGPEVESEPETKAVARLIENRKSDILCFLTIHSFGQLILSPYGYTKEPASNHQELVDVAQKAATALKGKHGTNFTVGPASSVLYQNSGSSRDWAHMIGIPFSYTLELRDRGAYAFFLPADQIQPTCEESTVAVMTIIEYVNQKYFPNGAKLTSGNLCLNLLLSVLFMWALS